MFKIHTLSAHSVVLFSKRKLRKGLKKEGDRTEKKTILLFRVSNVVSILRSSAFFFVVVFPQGKCISVSDEGDGFQPRKNLYFSRKNEREKHKTKR